MTTTSVRIDVPGNHLMVGLVGQHDEYLRIVEQAFPDTRVIVRGNEIAIEGPSAAEVGRVFEELVSLVATGHALEPAGILRSIDMVLANERPSEVLRSEERRVGKECRL